MSHALLLRLFLSPYFSISVAMHYLKTYSDSIGISHYLCWRMRGMSTEEVESYWPQICHLLLTYPTQSNALESFIIQRAEESTHSAMLTFWFMQAALRDLTPTRQTSPRPFLICQRVLHRCHEIIFGDVPEPGVGKSPYRSLPASPHANGMNGLVSSGDKAKKPLKVNPHALPALIGMGTIAMAVGMPTLRETVGEWAIMQGRQPRDDDRQGRERVEGAEGASEPKGRRLEQARKAVKARNEMEDEKVDLVSSDEEPRSQVSPERQKQPAGLHRGGSGSAAGTPKMGQARHTVPSPRSHPSQTAPDLSTPPNMSLEHLPSQSPLLNTPPADTDPFSVEEPLLIDAASPPSHAARFSSSARRAHYHSFPDLSHLVNPDRPVSANGRRGEYGREQPIPAEVLLANYSAEKQSQLLKSHYTRSEIRFLLVLEDISNRLLVVPKPARVPALRAELTSLNHNLPAEVCMPLWCTADHAHDSDMSASSSNVSTSPFKARRSSWSGNTKKKGHSRVVRISPGDSVVLNSAERAPFLLHVEILEGDLDFDPARRENRELLKKIVMQEDAKRRKKELGHGVGAGGSDLFTRFGGESSSNGHGRRPTGLGVDGFGSPMPDAPKPRPSAPAHATEKRADRVPPIEVEEVDLVEQMYGARVSVRDTLPELTDSLPLPSGPQNKATDAAAWSRTPTSAGPSRRTSFSPPQTANSGADAASAFGQASPAYEQNSNGLMPNAIPAPSGRTVQTEIPAAVEVYGAKRVITLEDYSERMRTAAVMLAQLNASLVPVPAENTAGRTSWIPGTGWILGSSSSSATSAAGGAASPGVAGLGMAIPGMPGVPGPGTGPGGAAADAGAGGKLRLAAAQAEAIRSRIMEEMMALEEERVERMTERPAGDVVLQMGAEGAGEGGGGTAEDEGIVRRELNKADPSAAVFKESWAAKKSRIRSASPWGHLANWDVISVIVKTGTDLRQEQLATQLIERFSRIFREEKCECWVRFFRILITGEQSGLVETITDAVSVHSIKKGEYARRLAEGGPMGRVSLMDHFVNTYGKPDSGRFARAQRAFIRSLAGYSVVTYLLQIKDRHNGNILVDRDGHLIHIDFGFMLSNSPGGNMGFEAAPFKFPLDYVEVLGGLESQGWKEFKRLFKEGFEAARKHSDSLITMVELMQKDSKLDCFALFGDQTAHHFRERFALGLTTSAVDAHLERLIVSSMGSNYTRLYDTFQYYSQGVL